MRNKKSADYNLAPEQFREMNRDFYCNYPQHYFLDKLDEIVLKISAPERLLAAYKNCEVKIGMMSADLTTDENGDTIKRIENAAKIELHETYIHCLECFIRLFIARASLNPCIWLEMNRLSIQNYHDALSKLAKGELGWLNSQLSEEATIQYAFTSGTELSETITSEIVKNWKEWIVFCAKELQDIKAYNAYKHGLTLRAQAGGISIGNEKGNAAFLRKHGDMINYIAKVEKEERFVWVKKAEFIDLDILCVHTQLFAELISNMISAGKHEFSVIDDGNWHFPNETMTPITLKSMKQTDNDLQLLFQGMISFQTELLYYTKPE